MMRQLISSLMIVTVMLALASCAGGGNSVTPMTPTTQAGMTLGAVSHVAQSQTHLWGYYDVYIDIESQTAEAVFNRDAMFAANVVDFINSKPAGLSFHINATPIGPDYVDVDIDVSITHPFPGLPQYNGYDVRGVFMGDGSTIMDYNGDLCYATMGVDQMMFADAVDGFGGPDGYTRWFNFSEFNEGGMPLFQYVHGKLASPGFMGTATINPYRYYADGLDTNEDPFSWLQTHADQHGVFSSGATNTRNYYLRFPNTLGVKYGYAIIANWEGTEPEQHPSNAPEAVALSVIDQSDLYYVEPLTKGGTLKLDLSVWNWYSHPVGGVMQDYRVFFESNILSSVYQFNSAEMTPVGGGENYSTYHVEIEPVNLTGVDGNELWVIVEQQGLDYTNEFGTVNLAGEDKLAALFRYGLYVSPIHECPDPTVTGINPDRLLTDVPYNDVEITGTDFLEGPYLAAKLVKAGQPDIIGTDVKHIDDTKITADFNLAGAAVGFWDVVVTNGCGSVGTGLGLVEIYSCGDMSALSSQWIWHVVDLLFDGAYSGTATTQLGTPYVIGVSRNGDVLCALPLAGGATITSPSLGSSMNRDVICDSQNRVYFTDATDYGRVRYIPFLDPPGWGTPVDFGIIESPWSIYRITIDENDNPVLLATSGNAMRVFHWNSGSADWDWTPVPAAVGTPGMIGDFDYNPIQHHYLLVQRYTPMRTDLHVVDKEGNLVTTLQDIFQGNTYSVLPGLAVDVEDSSCRIVAWGPYNEFWTLPSPFARINASYTDRKFALLQGVPQGGGSYLNIASPRGQFSHSNHCLVVAVHYINVWGEVPLPADW